MFDYRAEERGGDPGFNRDQRYSDRARQCHTGIADRRSWVDLWKGMDRIDRGLPFGDGAFGHRVAVVREVPTERRAAFCPRLLEGVDQTNIRCAAWPFAMAGRVDRDNVKTIREHRRVGPGDVPRGPLVQAAGVT